MKMENKKFSQEAGDNSTQIQANNINIYANNNIGNREINSCIVDKANEILRKLEYNKSMNPSVLGGDENLNTAAIMYLEEKGYVSVDYNESTKYNPIIDFSLTKSGYRYKESLERR